MDHVAEIKNRLNIKDLANRMGLEVIKVGSSLFVKSIYKEDKHPSLCIYPSDNRFYDYSSDQGGDLIDFYKDFYHIDFQRALEELCSMCGIEYNRQSSPVAKPSVPSIPEKPFIKAFDSALLSSLTKAEYDSFIKQVKEILGYDLNDLVKLTDENVARIKSAERTALKPLQLSRLEQNKVIFSELYYYCKMKGFDQSALLYLTQVRKLPMQKLNDFKIFTISNYNEVNNHMKKNFPLEELQKSGLYNKKDDGSGNLVFFQHRIVIPYLFNGDIVYMRGRYFDASGSYKTDKSKYIGLGNDALGLNATKRFFNLDVIKHMLKNERLYIVEGEFDAIALSHIGYNTICIPGVGNIPSINQFKKLLSFDICICADQDQAGQKMLKNVSDIFSSLGKEISVKELPTKDVNDFLVKYD